MNTVLYKTGLGLAIALLICLLPMPYGYYTLIRFTAMIVFMCMAIEFYKKDKFPLCVVAGALALLFQPLIKLALGRTLWNIVDVIVAVLLIVLYVKNKDKQ